MSRREKPQEDKPKVTRVSLVDNVSGTIVTVGSDIAERYLSKKKGRRNLYREFDPEVDGRDDDDFEADEEVEETPAPVKSVVKK